MGKGNSSHNRVALLIIAIITLITISLDHFKAFERLEWISYDQRMKLFRSDHPLHPDIAVVLIDEASMQAMNPLVGRWPWPRELYAELLDFFVMGGARSVAFDILFTENEKSDSGGDQLSNGDQLFIDAAANAGFAIQAFQVLREQSDNGDTIAIKNLPDDFIQQHAIKNARGFRDVGNNSFLHPIPDLYRASKGVGVVEIEPDADSVYRRVRLFSTYDGDVYPAISVSPLLSKDITIVAGRDNVTIGSYRIPTERSGHYLIQMAGKIEPYSISGIFDSIQKLREGDIENMLVYPDEFENKHIFIGASAIGLQDVKTTSLSSKTPGVMLHASVLSNILEDDFLPPSSKIVTYLTILILISLTTFILLRNSNLLFFLLTPLAITGIYVIWSIIWFNFNQLYEIASPVIGVLTATLTTFAYISFTEGKDKRKVKTMFSRYVSPQVVNQLVESNSFQQDLNVSSRENLSILFSDIRGFTSISEKLEPEKVVDLLNRYFSVMSEIAFKYDGTLDKFIGDAIMAFWGAPLRLPDHADKTVQTAIEMIYALDDVNSDLLLNNLPEIKIGIGINTGNVILGNIGSERKLDYTVIGDGVNLASRLEGLTKYYSVPIIISEYTYKSLIRPIPCALLDLVRVKGKKRPIRIYTPLSIATAHNEDIDILQQIEKQAEIAFNHYLNREWAAAVKSYQDLPLDGYREVLIKRCLEYKENAPEKMWDGVYTQTIK